MTTRFLRAFGTLAVALVVLAGCDSAVDSGGLAPMANVAQPIDGPTDLPSGCVGDYSLTSAAAGTFSITGGSASIISQTSSGTLRKAKVLSGGSFTLVFKPTGSSNISHLTMNNPDPMVACLPE